MSHVKRYFHHSHLYEDNNRKNNLPAQAKPDRDTSNLSHPTPSDAFYYKTPTLLSPNLLNLLPQDKSTQSFPNLMFIFSVTQSRYFAKYFSNPTTRKRTRRTQPSSSIQVYSSTITLLRIYYPSAFTTCFQVDHITVTEMSINWSACPSKSKAVIWLPSLPHKHITCIVSLEDPYDTEASFVT